MKMFSLRVFSYKFCFVSMEETRDLNFGFKWKWLSVLAKELIEFLIGRAIKLMLLRVKYS